MNFAPLLTRLGISNAYTRAAAKEELVTLHQELADTVAIIRSEIKTDLETQLAARLARRATQKAKTAAQKRDLETQDHHWSMA